MIEKIISILEKNGIGLWRITESRADTVELYFIKKELDIPRIKRMTQYSVELFRDFEQDGKKFRGMTNIIVTPGMGEGDIEGRVKSAYFAASFVKNPWFELPEAEKAPHAASKSDLAGMELKDTAIKLAQAAFSVDTAHDAFINSMEIFVRAAYIRIAASNGLDVSFDDFRVSGELVAQCVTPRDVEQFRQFDYDSLNMDGLKQKVTDTLRDVRARARSANPPKAGTYSIILTEENLAEVLSYYVTRSSASMIYPGYSLWKTGTDIQGEDIKGEKLTLSLVPSVPYSAEGVPMTDRPLITSGRLDTIHGAARFCYYLGVEPTGSYSKIACDNGTKALDEMRGEGVLEPVSFSDFQMDSMDGHFKGEIRLALLHHADGTVEELSGGSINGSITDVQDRLVFSKERYDDSTYKGPLALLIPDVQVAGI